MTIEAVLFDLDETLVRQAAPPNWESVTDLQVAEISPYFSRRGVHGLDLADLVGAFWATFVAQDSETRWKPGHPLEELRCPAGPVLMRDCLAERGVTCSDADAATLWQSLNRVPEAAFNNHLFVDAVSVLRSLVQQGVRMAVVTTRPDSGTELGHRLSALGLPDFDAVVTGGDVGYKKPHPRLFEEAIERLSVAPGSAVFVGDSYEYDIVPAAGLGMTTVLKLNERPPDPALVLAHHQVSSLAEILSIGAFRGG